MTQRYTLDTNVVSHIMQGRDAALLARLAQVPVGQAVISSVTLAEIEYGLHRKGQPACAASAPSDGSRAPKRQKKNITPSLRLTPSHGGRRVCWGKPCPIPPG